MNALDLAECQASLRNHQLNDWSVTLHSTNRGSRFLIRNPEGKTIAIFGRYTGSVGWWAHNYSRGFDLDPNYCSSAVEAMNRAIKIWRGKSAQRTPHAPGACGQMPTG